MVLLISEFKAEPSAALMLYLMRICMTGITSDSSRKIVRRPLPAAQNLGLTYGWPGGGAGRCCSVSAVLKQTPTRNPDKGH